MNVSPIPPVAHLNEIQGRRFHLTLAHLYDDPRYLEFYRSEADHGAFVTIDNGAHEVGSGESAGLLLRLAKAVRAGEIVLADYLFEADQTISLTAAAVKYLEHHPEQVQESGISSIAIVPQGRDIWSYKRCLYHLIETVTQSDLDLHIVLGISKDYNEMFEGGLYRLLERDILPVAETLDYDVHLLGWTKSLWDLGDIGRHFGNRIRSIDSARPFVYGLNEISLAWYLDRDPPEYPKRSENYFECTMTEDQLVYARKNVEVFDLLAQGTRLGVTQKRGNHWLLEKD